MRQNSVCLTTAFARGTAGTIAPIFALSLFVIIGAVGLAVDAARGYGAKSHLQNAVDTATLAAARRLYEEPSADPSEVFNTFFNTSRPTAHDIKISSISVQKTDNVVEATVEASMPVMFMGVLGQPAMGIVAQSATEFGLGEMELALALDNTGSMSGAKIDALKTAALDLVETLDKNAPSTDKLRIGVVPFARYVNVGMGYRNAPWMSVPADWTETKYQCYDTYPNATKSNCRMVTGTCSNDGTPYSCTYEECDWVWGNAVNVCGNNVINHVWKGCVYSRAYPLNVKDSDYATRIPGMMDTDCSTPITPLTSNRQSIRDAINAMSASGETYIPEGLMWGWRVLSPTAPFDQSLSGGGTKVNRYLVLMTDGENTASSTPDGHNGSDAAQANTYTTEACTNIKADGVTIFTVAFQVTNAAIKDILSGCASSPGFFYDATDSNKLTDSFKAIGQAMVSLRIKK